MYIYIYYIFIYTIYIYIYIYICSSRVSIEISGVASRKSPVRRNRASCPAQTRPGSGGGECYALPYILRGPDMLLTVALPQIPYFRQLWLSNCGNCGNCGKANNSNSTELDS